MLEEKGKLRKDFADVCALFDFVTEKKRTQREVDEFINSLAHGKYCLDSWSNGHGLAGKGTAKGHALRKQYKRFLRRNLARMLSSYSRFKKEKESDGT